MSQLTPCPECQRHVRKTEARCPFCDSALSLADVPAPALPRRRMSRAATFAFGAGVVGATTFGGAVTSRMIDQRASHQPRRHAEKVSPVLPADAAPVD